MSGRCTLGVGGAKLRAKLEHHWMGPHGTMERLRGLLCGGAGCGVSQGFNWPAIANSMPNVAQELAP